MNIGVQKKVKLCRITHYDKIAHDTFIAGYTGLLKNDSHFKTPKHQTLEDVKAMEISTNGDNHFNNPTSTEKTFERQHQNVTLQYYHHFAP